MTLKQLKRFIDNLAEKTYVDSDADVDVEIMVGRKLISCPIVDIATRPQDFEKQDVEHQKVVMVLQ